MATKTFPELSIAIPPGPWVASAPFPPNSVEKTNCEPAALTSVTVASLLPAVRVLPSVTGKSVDVVVPAIAAFPFASTARNPPSSSPLPPMNVKYSSEFNPLFVGSSFAMK
jgi:hypothetical protein